MPAHIHIHTHRHVHDLPPMVHDHEHNHGTDGGRYAHAHRNMSMAQFDQHEAEVGKAQVAVGRVHYAKPTRARRPNFAPACGAYMDINAAIVFDWDRVSCGACLRTHPPGQKRAGATARLADALARGD